MTEAPSIRPEGTARCIHCGESHPVTYAHCPRTGKDITAGEALIGRVIAGRYRVVGLLGEGGMGAVYVAEHTLLGRKVAIKRLHPELTAERNSVIRFHREARAAGATGHEHIVDVLDMGVAEDGAPYLVMEYLQGENLATVLGREGRLAPARACHLVGQALDALEAVHQKGIIHRDLKPDNLFLTRRGGRPDYVKLLDFGVSKMRRQEGEPFDMTLTRTGVMVGTPYYMSPEQARGVKDHDHRVDLYAMGVILYRCLGGRLPFDAPNYHALLQAILHGSPPPVAELAPGIGEDLAAVVHRALALDPRERFARARAMRLALEPHGASAPAGAFDLATTRPYRDGPPAGGATLARGEASPATSSPKGPRAPAPGPLARKPVRFEARSSDWDDRRAPAPLDRLEPGPPATPTPQAAAAVPLRSDTPGHGLFERPTQVKGSLVLAAMDVLRSAHGTGLRERILATLPADIRRALEHVTLPGAWVPLDHYVRLLEATERVLGDDDVGRVAAELGEAAADADLPSTHRMFILSATPLLAVRRLPQLFAAYHKDGRIVCEPSTGGSWRVIHEALNPDTTLHALALTGFYRRLLELTGAREAKAWLMSSRGRGDPHTVISLRWR